MSATARQMFVYQTRIWGHDYQIECAVDGMDGNLLARVPDVDEAVLDGGVDQLLCDAGLGLVAVGRDVDDGYLCNIGHVDGDWVGQSIGLCWLPDCFLL